MTAMLSIFVPGRPIAFARSGANGGKRFTPERQKAYMTAVGLIGRSAMAKAGYEPFEGPLELTYRATFDWPPTWPQKRKDRIRHKTSKPDASNLVKLAEDALNKIVFGDDAQIVSLRAEKVYGVPEGAMITVSCLGSAEASA